METGGPDTNWRDPAAYAPLLDADRSIFAWEWLRRDAGYREAARHASEGGGPSPLPWGLAAFEDPERAAPAARPVWTGEVDPYVLQAVALPCGRAENLLDLGSLGDIAAIQFSWEIGERLLLSDGLRTIRVDIEEGSLRRGPVQLRYALAGVASAQKPLLTLRRLLALQRDGRFSRALHPREARARRWIMMLRAHDALAAGADQRAIAASLLSGEAETPRWRSRAPSLRSQAQRLVRSARQTAEGGYRDLLRS